MMSALVRQRDQRIAPLYTAGLSIVAHRKSLDRFFWDILTFHKVLYSRPKVECILDELTTRLPDLPVFTSRSNSIGLAVIDNKAYFIKEVHQHADSDVASDKGDFLYTNNWMTLPLTIQLNLDEGECYQFIAVSVRHIT